MVLLRPPSLLGWAGLGPGPLALKMCQTFFRPPYTKSRNRAARIRMSEFTGLTLHHQKQKVSLNTEVREQARNASLLIPVRIQVSTLRTQGQAVSEVTAAVAAANAAKPLVNWSRTAAMLS